MDHYTCRYCGVRTFVWDLWKQLGRLFGDTFAYHPNWRWPDAHQSTWLYAVSFDHIVPRCVGGGHGQSNVVTACDLHQHVKANRSLGSLGWKLRDIDRSGWDGLAGKVAELGRVVGHLTGGVVTSSHRKTYRTRQDIAPRSFTTRRLDRTSNWLLATKSRRDFLNSQSSFAFASECRARWPTDPRAILAGAWVMGGVI